MTIISVGYAGTITDDNWRRMATAAVGALYGVDDFASWRVTAGVGDRALQVATGGAFGLGVRDVSDDPVIVTGGTVSSGSRWDLVVARRNWGTKVTTIVIIPGSAAKALPARNTGFGAVNDQPLALARFAAGQTAVQEIIDLRCIPGDGGVLAFDDLARSYLDRVGTSVRIGDVVWDRAIDATGSPAWVSTEQTDTGWVSIDVGPGWVSASGAAAGDFRAEVRAIGAVVQLRGALTAQAANAVVTNLGNVGGVFRPLKPTPLGAAHGSSSTTFVGELMIQPSGLLQVPVGYYDGGLGVGRTVPLHGTWFRG